MSYHFASSNFDPPLTSEQLAEVERIAQSRPAEELAGEDDWCCGAVDEVSKFLDAESVEHIAWYGDLRDVGATFDSSHSWLEVDGWVVDPTITQFLGPRASDEQCKAVKGFPSHPAAPTVAVVPADHPMRRSYYH